MTGAGRSPRWTVALGVVVAALVPVLTGCVATPSAPASTPVSPPVREPAPIFRQVLPQLDAETDVPVLLPGEVPLPDSELYVDAETTPRGYAVHLGHVPRCRGTACFIGMFAGKRTEGAYHAGEVFEETVRLAGGVEGFFNPVRCAASCGPAVIEWTRDGVRYRFALKAFSPDPGDEKETMVRLASSAIAAGDRRSRSQPD